MKKSYVVSLVILTFFLTQTRAQFTTSGINTTTTNNVGIGTSAPLSPLFISGENQTEGPSIPKVLAVSDPSDVTKTISLGYDKILDVGVLASVDTGTGWKSTLIQPYGGNLGIGVTSPSSKLHLRGDMKIEIGEGFRVHGNSNYFGANLDGIIFEAQDSNGSNGVVDGGFVFRGYTPTDQVAQEWMTIRNGGKVGIGVSIPTSKLHVSGDVKINAGEGFKIHGDGNYFGTNLDGIIFEAQDSNGSNGVVDGGFVFRGYTPTDQVAQEWMTIRNGGKVGIGVSIPTSKLHVSGDVKINAGEGFKIHGDGNYFGTNLDGIIFEAQDSNGSNGVVDGGFVFRGYTPTDQVAQEWMTIRNGGKVGIGVSIPTSKLHVSGDVKINAGEGFRIHGDSNYFGTHLDGIIFEMQDVNSSNGTTDGGFVFRGYTPTDQVAKEWVVIKSGGNVGIGTSIPKNKLSVNGTIWAKKVKVRLTDAADWVFEDDYELRPLSEVKSFVSKNKHLPEIPSAAEFRANDMEVSEMTNKLLQKIEELTLYTIQQEEKLKTQKEINSTLESRLQKIEAVIKSSIK
ncbi:hypothetical protein [Aquimarina pacifica]|uniref:hypothetical protein n=1 Tax=Aquimarina pacifica TaxID=1296415 RepID=UPI000472B161|nr:hypothetical protein [Aquimarina pacifica]